MRPEEESELILWDWLKTKGNVEEVYFNRTNELGWKVFTTSGINKKPDFVVLIERGYGKEYIAIEIKNASSSRNVHDSGKILMYYENFIKRQTHYFINETEIKINHFVIATEQSLKGKLFLEDETIISNVNSTDWMRQNGSKFGMLPEFEYQRTSDFVRRLWAEWRTFKKENKLEKQELPSIGILISNPDKDNFPYLQIQIYAKWRDKKRWTQKFLRI